MSVTRWILAATPLLLACRTEQTLVEPDPHLNRMLVQEKRLPYDVDPNMPHGMTMQPPPPGTLSTAEIAGDPARRTGVAGDRWVERIPISIDRTAIDRGRAHFDTLCAACHGVLGDGNSVVAEKMALRKPRNLLDPGVRTFPPGRIFETVRDGYGLMPPYAAWLSYDETWEVIAYVRALELARGAVVADLPPGVRARLLGGAMNARRTEQTALAAASLGLVGLAVGLVIQSTRAWFSYLEAWTCALTVCAGALILLMAGHASKASWMAVTTRPAEAVVSALPLCALLFVPMLFALPKIYAWAGTPGPGVDETTRAALAHRSGYMNASFFLARSAVYLGAFVVIGELLRHWSRENDRRPRPALVLRMRRLGAGAMPLVALLFTWASFDWTMSLERQAASTIFGLYFFAGAFVGAIALVTLIMLLSRRAGEVRAGVTIEHVHAVARLMFAMICFWAYMAFSQLLLIWIANIPREAEYYVRRSTGSWAVVSAALVVGMFAAPFFALLSRPPKRNPGALAVIAVWIFVMHYVDVYWLVMPPDRNEGRARELARRGRRLLRRGPGVRVDHA